MMERSLSGSSIIGSNSLLSTSSTFGNHADKLIGRNPMDASFTVCVRIRPPNQREISGDMPICFIPTTDGTGVEELDCDHGHTIKFWHYDHVFGPELGNREIFSTVGVKLADAALDGYNAVGFVYGQTSSGKTHTLFGTDKEVGLIDTLFEYVYGTVSNSKESEYVLRLSYVELYNEDLRDLLAATSPSPPLKIVEDPGLGPLIQGATEVNFSTPHDVKLVLEEGERRRHFGITNMNVHSSRSHVLVRLTIESRKIQLSPTSMTNSLRQSWNGDRPSCISVLNLVDLAGSERASKTGNRRESLKEGSFINKSLLTLGNVINLLSEGKRAQHVPYRNSKLTRLLSSALGGNAKTLIVTCISPASENILETLSSLRFSSRAKKVVNQVYQHTLLDVKTLQHQLSLQNMELEELRNSHQNMIDTLKKSYKDRVITSSKNYKQMKYILKYAPIVVMELKQLNLYNQIYQIKDDIKAVIVDQYDVDAAVEYLSSVIYSYLPRNLQIVHSIENLYREIDDDYAMMMADTPMNLDQADILDEALYVSIDDVYNGMNLESDELREEIESLSMYHEESEQYAVYAVTILRDTINQLKQEIKKHEQYNKKNISLIKSMQDDSLEATRKELDLKSQINLQDMTIQSKDQEIATQAAKLSELQSRLNLQEKELESLRENILTKDETIEMLSTTNKALETETTILKNHIEKVDREYHEEKQQMSSEVSNLIRENELSVQKHLDKLIHELQEKKKDIAIKENRIRELEKDSKDLKLVSKTFQELQINYDEKMKELEDLNVSIDNLVKELADSKELNDRLESDQKVLSDENQHLKSTIETYEIALNLSQQHTKLVSIEMNKCKELLNNRQNEYDRNNEARMTEMNEFKAIKESLDYHLQQQQNQNVEYSLEIVKLKKDNQRIQSEHDQITTALVLAEREIQQLQANLKEKEDMERKYAEVVQIHQKAQEDLKQDRLKHHQIHDDLSNRYDHLSQEYGKLENVLKENQQRFDDVVEENERKRLDLENAVKSLQRTVASLENERDVALSELSKSEKDTSELRYQLEQVKAKSNQLQEYFDTFQRLLSKEITPIEEQYDENEYSPYSVSPTRQDGASEAFGVTPSPVRLSSSRSMSSPNESHFSSQSTPKSFPPSPEKFSSFMKLRDNDEEEDRAEDINMIHSPAAKHVIKELKNKVFDLLNQVEIMEKDKMALEEILHKETQTRKLHEDVVHSQKAMIARLNDHIGVQNKELLSAQDQHHYKILYDSLNVQLKKIKSDCIDLQQEKVTLERYNSDLLRKIDEMSVENMRIHAELTSNTRQYNLTHRTSPRS